VRPGAQQHRPEPPLKEALYGFDGGVCLNVNTCIDESLNFFIQNGTGKTEGINSQPEYSPAS